MTSAEHIARFGAIQKCFMEKGYVFVEDVPWLVDELGICLEANDNLRASNERNGVVIDACMAGEERMAKTLRDHGFVRRGKIESDIEAAISQCRQRERDAFERGARAMREAARRVALNAVDSYTALTEETEDEIDAESFETFASVAADIAVSIEALSIPQDSDTP